MSKANSHWWSLRHLSLRSLATALSLVTCHFLLLLLLLTSCKFTDWGGDWEDGDPGDFSFVETGIAYPAESLRAAYKYGYYIYGADGNGRLSVFYVSDNFNPYKVSTVPVTSQSIRKIEYDSFYSNLYLAAGSAGMYIVNVTNANYPSQPIVYNNIYALDLSYRNDRLAVTDYNGFKLYDVVNSNSLAELSSYSYFISRQPQKLYMTDYWLFVFTATTLDIFDVTNPYNIREERNITLSGSFIDYTIINGYLAVITSSYLQMFDIAQPLNTVLSHEFGVSKTAQMMRYNGGYLYISWTDRSLSVYKVYSINNMDEVARKSFDRRVLDIEFQSDFIYLSNEENGLRIFRLVALGRQ